MPTITQGTKTDKTYDDTVREFNDFLKANMDFIKQITPKDPPISKDDEWNDPIYDKYDTLENPDV